MVKKRQRKLQGNRKQYRKQVPTTIEIATKRNMNQTLKFVVNQTYLVDPAQIAVGKCAVLSYRANSLYKCHMPTGNTAQAALFKSQDPTKYNNNGQLDPVISQNADGWDEWTERYQHFCVTGSKISYTYEPVSTGAPAIFFSHLSGVAGAITADTLSSRLNELPYTTRHSQPSGGIGAYSMGIRGSRKYSARAFEGVKDPQDNSNLRGRFANSQLNPPTTGNTPGEQSFFYIGMAPVDPLTTQKMAAGVLRVKIEYIAQLKEPTESNQIQATGTAHAGDL